jgi:hypothetical protein
MRKILAALMCVAASFVLWALLSYITTVSTGEDDWPPASLRVQVLDSAGLPIEGATLSLFRANIKATEFQKTYCYSLNWASNKNGMIDLLVKPLRYKVTSWRLFWFIPIRSSSADFEVRIDAPGFERANVPLRSLLDASGFKGRRRVDEAEAARGFSLDEFDIIHATVVLER